MSRRTSSSAQPQRAKDAVSALTTLLKEMISERHRTHALAVSLIARNFAKGEQRARRPKLRLSLEDLVQHEAAKQVRRQTQRELKVLVPLLRRVVTGVQHKDNFDPETSATLRALNCTLSPLAQGSGNHVEFEKPLASLFMTAFPSMLAQPLAPEPKPSEPRKGRGQAKLELFNKITSADLLSTSEIAALRAVFWD